MIRLLLNRIKEYIHGKDEDGSEVVTFVIIIPLFIFIFSMMITFSQIIYAGSVALNAANAGCRQAITQTSRRAGEKIADQVVEAYVKDSGMGVTLNDCAVSSEGSWSRGNMCYTSVTVKVKTAVPMNWEYGHLSSYYSVSRTCPMMIERDV